MLTWIIFIIYKEDIYIYFLSLSRRLHSLNMHFFTENGLIIRFFLQKNGDYKVFELPSGIRILVNKLLNYVKFIFQNICDWLRNEHKLFGSISIEKCYCNPNSVWFNKIMKLISLYCSVDFVEYIPLCIWMENFDLFTLEFLKY